MDSSFGKVFINSYGEEFGVIRETNPPYPDEISKYEVIAEDECGNYFTLEFGKVCFWEHETNNRIVLANSIKNFIVGCSQPSDVELKPEEVESAWIDPDFAKQFSVSKEP
jgi:hypothetical protein